jgi:hypothetical protein
MQGRDYRAARGLASALMVACAAVAGLPSSATAQQVQGSATTPVMSFFVRGVDTAADAYGNYLVVGGQGTLNAMCINAAGVPVSGVIPLNAAATGYASFPRVAYAQNLNNGLGGFMVVWGETPAGNPDTFRQLVARPVSCWGAVGPAQVVAGSVWWEPGNVAIKYSSTSRRFLVAWQNFPERQIRATVISLAGAPIAGEVQLSPGQARDPSVAWDWTTDHFGVSFSGETYSALTIVPAANPALFSRNTFNTSSAILTTMTDIAFNPFTRRYLMTWFEISGGSFAKVAEFNNTGNLLSAGVASTRLGSYDALAMAMNHVTGTFLMVGVDRASDTPLGLELNIRGFPFNGENTLSGTRPSYYPRVSATPVNRTWNVAFSGPTFSALSSLIATSFASNGGPGGSFDAPVPGPLPAPGPPPPPPPPPLPGVCPGAAPVPGWVCVSGNWVPPDHPLAGGGGVAPAPLPQPPPTSCTTIQPGPDWSCVNGNWLPITMACPTIRPGPNWRCVNGNWLPPQ